MIAIAFLLGLLCLAHPGMARAAGGEAEVDVANEYDAEEGGPPGEVIRWGVLREDADLVTPQGQPGVSFDRLAALAQAPPDHITEVILEGGARKLSHEQIKAGGLAGPYLEFPGSAGASEIVLVLPGGEAGTEAHTISSGPGGMLTMKLLLNCDVIHVGPPQVEQQGLPASEPLAGTPVEFKAHSEDIPGSTETWNWSFGDTSGPSHEAAPTHTFASTAQPGTTNYDVYAELTVHGPSGEEATGVSFLRLPVRTEAPPPPQTAIPPLPAPVLNTPIATETMQPSTSSPAPGPVTQPKQGNKKRKGVKKKASRKKRRDAKKKRNAKKKRSAKKKHRSHSQRKTRLEDG